MWTKSRFFLLFVVCISSLTSPTGVISGWAGGVHQQGADLLLPDLQTLPPQDLLLLVGGSGERMLVRFSNSVANLGQGAAELHGEYNQSLNIVQISQNVTTADEEFITREVGEFSFHREHDHWHWDDFALYEVWLASLDGVLLEQIASSGKVGYCLRDDDPLPGGAPTGRGAAVRGVYLGCGWRRQGISVGWMDTYSLHTPGQFVDISGAADGLYALRSTVDPDNRLLELDESNNTAILFFTLMRNKLRVIGDSITPLPDGPDHPGCFGQDVMDIGPCKH